MNKERAREILKDFSQQLGEYGQVICIGWMKEIALKVVELRNDETLTAEQKQAWLKKVEEYKRS